MTPASPSPPPITLYQFPPVWGRNASPFTLKLEAWLRLAGVPYEVSDSFADFRRAPKGKLPYIDDRGRRIADSGLIIEYLSRSRGIDLDGWLSPRQRAEALALQRLLEDHFYFILGYARWLDPVGWPAVRAASSLATAWSMVKLAAFWRGGKSLKVARNCVITAVAASAM